MGLPAGYILTSCRKTHIMVDRLLVHPLCPYAQRALYALAYKGGQGVSVEEVDLVRKPEALLRANPCGLVPTLVRAKGRPVTESLVLVEYFDSLPGPDLFPKKEDGTIDQSAKHVLDTAIHSLSYDLDSYWGYFDSPSPRNQDYMSRIAHKLDALVPNGHYFASQLLGMDVITAVDVVEFPMVERLAIIADGAVLADCRNLAVWFDRMSAQGWIQRHKAEPRRLKRLVEMSAAGEYRGLELPLSRYD